MRTAQQMEFAGSVQALREHLGREMRKVIIGQQELREQCLMALLCGGHALLEGVPGIAKTLAVKTLACLLRMDFRRVQCTSDLMPADILGGNIFNSGTGSFELHRGCVFTDLLLVDEINRMPPRTQAALLEGMEERQVTIDGARHLLSANFTVFATQNPVEFEGTYPLPEAQLDRFLLKIRVAYPRHEEEEQLLAVVQGGFDWRKLDAIDLEPIAPDMLANAQRELSSTKVEPQLFRYITSITHKTRNWPAVSLGASPRAAIALMMLAKAAAALDGRDYVLPDDVKTVAGPVLRHRILLKPEADLEGVTSDQVVTDVLRAVEVPK